MAEERGWIDLAAGDEFAAYRIERTLGRGGMGILYLAREAGLERHVALKLIAPEAAADEVFSRRFAEESRIAAAIEHPNVVPIYAAGEVDGVPFIAMRYVSGSDLGRRLAREGRLEPQAAVALIAQVGNGLDAIHAAGLVHRDVKPANVLLSGAGSEGHAYITDFGVARNVATESGLTQTGRFVGTLDYVAPEQISGAPVDARADVYALGCLLFKLLTGEVPFPRDGEAARLYAHLEDPPPAPSLYAPEVPPALDAVVARAMSKEPGDRHPSAGDLGRAAAAALTGERPTLPERTVATGAAATTEPVRPRPAHAGEGEGEGRRRWAPFALAAGALLALAVAAIAIAGGGGGDGSGSGRSGSGAPTPEVAAQPLSRSELIGRADAICEQSRSRYTAVLDATRERAPAIAREEVPDVEFSRQLVGISSPAVERFRALKPPPELRDAYDRYVDSQEDVKRWDEEALQAARRGDASAYLEAREDRDQTEDDRKEMAEAVGLRVCSNSEL